MSSWSHVQSATCAADFYNVNHAWPDARLLVQPRFRGICPRADAAAVSAPWRHAGPAACPPGGGSSAAPAVDDAASSWWEYGRRRLTAIHEYERHPDGCDARVP